MRGGGSADLSLEILTLHGELGPQLLGPRHNPPLPPYRLEVPKQDPVRVVHEHHGTQAVVFRHGEQVLQHRLDLENNIIIVKFIEVKV